MKKWLEKDVASTNCSIYVPWVQLHLFTKNLGKFYFRYFLIRDSCVTKFFAIDQNSKKIEFFFIFVFV